MLEQLNENGRGVRRPFGVCVISARVTEKELVRLRKGSAELEHRLADFAFAVRRWAAQTDVFGEPSFEQRLRPSFDCEECMQSIDLRGPRAVDLRERVANRDLRR